MNGVHAAGTPRTVSAGARDRPRGSGASSASARRSATSEFAQQRRHVRLDGAHRQVQPRRDLRVRQVLAQGRQHLGLPLAIPAPTRASPASSSRRGLRMGPPLPRSPCPDAVNQWSARMAGDAASTSLDGVTTNKGATDVHQPAEPHANRRPPHRACRRRLRRPPRAASAARPPLRPLLTAPRARRSWLRTATQPAHI